jgi:hypothetical protein
LSTQARTPSHDTADQQPHLWLSSSWHCRRARYRLPAPGTISQLLRVSCRGAHPNGLHHLTGCADTSILDGIGVARVPCT